MSVEAVCAHPKKFEDVAAGCRAATPPPHWVCESQRRLTRLVPPVPGVYAAFTHKDCVCNEMIAARNRVQGVVPKPTAAGMRKLKRSSKRLSRRFGKVEPLTTSEFVACYTGRRRGRYQAAVDAIAKLGPVTKQNAKVSCFVKAEKFDPAAKVNPDPRMIQCRSYEYNVEVGVYLKAIEHQLYGMKSPTTGLRMLAKGLNMSDRAALLKSKLECFVSPVVFSIDGSRWDKHIDVEVLKLEHAFYESVCPCPRFAQLLSWQLFNRCSTKHGVKYTVKGKRMSGDMNTALGNCLLMCIMVMAAMRDIGVKRWDLLDDGDDCLVVVEEWDFAVVQSLLGKVFLEFGQEIKIENVAREMEDISFCQTRPVLVGDEWRMVKDWKKVLSTVTSGERHWSVPSLVRPMLSAVGAGELALSAGVPILQEHAKACLRNGRGVAAPKWYAEEYQLHHKLDGMCLREQPITWDTRLSFQRAFGVCPQQQMDIEAILAAWEIDGVVAVDRPAEISGADWRQDIDPEDELCTVAKWW